MVESQSQIGMIVDDFRFNLGFSGKYFRHGTADENAGDDELLGTNCVNIFLYFFGDGTCLPGTQISALSFRSKTLRVRIKRFQRNGQSSKS